jgi:hypothetical protein
MKSNYKIVKVWGTVIAVIIMFYVLTTVLKAVAGFVIAGLVLGSVCAMIVVTDRDEEKTSVSPIVKIVALPAQIALAAVIGIGTLVKNKAQAYLAHKP